jgi:hypothetical protein
VIELGKQEMIGKNISMDIKSNKDDEIFYEEGWYIKEK